MKHKDYDDLQKNYKLGTKILLGTVIFVLVFIILIMVKLNK